MVDHGGPGIGAPVEDPGERQGYGPVALCTFSLGTIPPWTMMDHHGRMERQGRTRTGLAIAATLVLTAAAAQVYYVAPGGADALSTDINAP